MEAKRLRHYVQEEFFMDLRDFLEQKIQKEALYDYEIASLLGACPATIGRIRRRLGIAKADGFFKRFEEKYGPGSINRFMKMIEDPRHSLSTVGRHFGFSREYARQVYYKLSGQPYTSLYRKKRRARAMRRRLSVIPSCVKEK
jgi:hypothetical protein